MESKAGIGFDADAAHPGYRFVNPDGSYNLRRRGLPWWRRVSVYSYMLELSWTKFLVVIMLAYLLIGLAFTAVFIAVGFDQIEGFITADKWEQTKETFYFSLQTFTTVGYGRLNPIGDGAEIVSSIEAFAGWVFFAVITGLLYGRFTRPKAHLLFSKNLLVSPYRDGRALVFRVVPYKDIHQLSEAKVTATLSLTVPKDGGEEYAFYQLPLEQSCIEMFNMNWTIIHAIDKDSPVVNFSRDDFARVDFELMVQLSGYDPVYSNHVMQRTSYTLKEMIWGARFCSMYHQSKDGKTTIIDIDQLNRYEEVNLPGLVP
jgi:inward rectifier potassium channel